jgi:hypothetical protein
MWIRARNQIEASKRLNPWPSGFGWSFPAACKSAITKCFVASTLVHLVIATHCNAPAVASKSTLCHSRQYQTRFLLFPSLCSSSKQHNFINNTSTQSRNKIAICSSTLCHKISSITLLNSFTASYHPLYRAATSVQLVRGSFRKHLPRTRILPDHRRASRTQIYEDIVHDLL